jgi:hypothetical protein
MLLDVVSGSHRANGVGKLPRLLQPLLCVAEEHLDGAILVGNGQAPTWGACT